MTNNMFFFVDLKRKFQEIAKSLEKKTEKGKKGKDLVIFENFCFYRIIFWKEIVKY